jgi:predicted Fe-Mo cluster-binding NifX family protein
VDELEALRLADREGLTAIDAAQHMRVSRHTFGRTLAAARRKVATALSMGQALRIEGGSYAVHEGGHCRHGAGHGCSCHTSNESKEISMQKIAISSEGPTLEDWVDPRFGRAGGFVVVELPERKLDYIDNGASQMMAMGAGIETAERMAAAGVEVVLSGYVGPKAFDALTAAGIKICQDVEGITIGEAIENYVAGKYPFATESNKQ